MVQGCLRVADAAGNPVKLALVRALQEALHEERNALPAMGSEWKRIDKEARKAMWRKAAKAEGEAKAAAFGRNAGAGSSSGGSSRRQQKSKEFWSKKGWRGPGWHANQARLRGEGNGKPKGG